MKGAGKKTSYTSTIPDTRDGVPLFRVTPEDLLEDFKVSFFAKAVHSAQSFEGRGQREEVGMSYGICMLNLNAAAGGYCMLFQQHMRLFG